MRLVLALGGIVLILDQATKWIALRRLPPGAPLSVIDGFFSLNAQAADLDLMPRRLRAVIRASDAARAAAARVPPLRLAADSLYVRSTVSD